ncbi:MAG: ribose 5-phosphate isomerase B [Dehalococcoidales bacterium]|nr:ribose 5-phosphate isomerase B [Dehalococcoidales bacterium]
MRIAIGCDHRGLNLKKTIIKLITQAGHSYKDFGAFSTEPVDYPDIARAISEAVTRGEFDRGILICGTGIGMCITANKVKGIRAALCYSTLSASWARQHNDANVLCLSAEETPKDLPEIIDAFLSSDFEGGRHQRRVDKIKDME